MPYPFSLARSRPLCNRLRGMGPIKLQSRYPYYARQHSRTEEHNARICAGQRQSTLGRLLDVRGELFMSERAASRSARAPADATPLIHADDGGGDKGAPGTARDPCERDSRSTCAAGELDGTPPDFHRLGRTTHCYNLPLPRIRRYALFFLTQAY